MSLTPGQTLTFYEVLGPLGVGGMGEVYRARDTRLGREVAIKVLPEAMASDEERLRRFEREAKTLASLNHPNIAGIHGVDQVDGVWFLALELVPGEDLATRIARAPLPVDEAIDVCRQIAEGLEAAHEAGVVHRDLKPANVRVTPEGTVKLLDFGLAKPIQPQVSGGGTSTSESDSFLITEQGVVLGTPTYMSPEQARGKPVDRRTDLWAFGCVLYECLTGERAFGAPSFTDVLAKIVSDEPDWSLLPPLPPRVEELLRRALIKDPRTRLRDAGEARVQLQLAQSEPSSSIGTAAVATEPLQPRAASRRGLAVALTAALCLLVGWSIGALVGSEAPAGAEVPAGLAAGARSAHDLNVVLETLPSSSLGNDLMISPDGTQVAWIGAGRLSVRRLNELASTVVVEADLGDSGREAVPTAVCWSPDGEQLAFLSGAGIYRLPAAGGPLVPVVEGGEYQARPQALHWTEDVGLIYLSENGGEVLSTSVPAGETVARLSAKQVGVEHFDGLAAFPGGGILVVNHRVGVAFADSLQLWRDGELSDVLELPGWTFEKVAVAGDVLVVERTVENKHSLWTIPFDADTAEVTGEPELHVVRGMYPSASRDGVLLYLHEEGTTQTQPVWVDHAGQVESFGPRLDGEFVVPRLSHDERQVFLSMPQRTVSVLAFDIERGVATSALTNPEPGTLVTGSLADGRLLVGNWVDNQTSAYHGSRPGDRELLSEGLIFDVDPTGERGLVLRSDGGGAPERPLEILDLESGELTPLDHCQVSGIGGPSFSPDGRYVLFPSTEPGRTEVFLAESKVGGRRWQVTTEGSQLGRFDGTGKWIYCAGGGKQVGSGVEVWRVSLETEPTVRLGVPERMFALEDAQLTLTDYHTGQQRFLGIRSVGEGDQQIVLDTSLRRAR